MPIIHHDAGDGIPECFLLLIDPHGASKVTYRRASQQVEALSGIEDRSPSQRANRLRQDLRFRLSAQEAADLRSMLATLGGVRIGVPLWCDAYSTTWIHAPQRSISWTDAGAYAILAAGAEEIPHERHAPLLIGRLVERPKMEAIGVYELALAIEEDSPWECRIEPAAGTIPVAFEWEPDYTKLPQDFSRDQLRLSEMGQAREAGVAGTDGTPRWGQKAGFTLTRAETAALLRFWSDRDGAVRSFDVPAWCKPGENTPQTPHNLTARFEKDFIELNFPTPELVMCELGLWQEVALEDPEADQASEAKGYFYVFLPEGATTKRFTSWEHALTYGANTYTPAKISHEGLRQTLSPVGDECSISTFAEWDENPLLPFVTANAERRIRVEIHEVRIAADGTVTRVDELITGEIRSLEHREDKIVGKIAGFGGVFSRKLPRFYIQKGCNYVFGDANCKLVKGDFAKAGPLGADVSTSVVQFTPAVPPVGLYGEKWFAGGWIEVTGTDGEFHRRAILDCTEALGVWSLTLNRILPATCAEQTATAYPGDDGNYSTCKGKFGNGDNFGGHPFAPAFISTSDGIGGGGRAK